jgi:hypothetical protein
METIDHDLARARVLGSVYAHDNQGQAHAVFQPSDQITLGISGTVQGSVPVPASQVCLPWFSWVTRRTLWSVLL